MSKFNEQKSSFLSAPSVSRMVQQMKSGGVEICKPAKAGRPWSAKFPGGPKSVNVISPPRSQKENVERSEQHHGTVVWDIQIGNPDAENESIQKRKATASKAAFSVSVLKDTAMYKSLSDFHNDIVRCAVELLVQNAKEPFKGTEDIDDLIKKTTFLIKEKEESKYPPNMQLVVKPGPNDKKFTAGFLNHGFAEESGGLMIEEEPEFSWDNIDEYVKKGAVVHKAKGSMEYASVFYRNGDIASINLQFQVSKIILSLPIDAKDAYDSDEVVMSRPSKRPRLTGSVAGDEETDEVNSENDD